MAQEKCRLCREVELGAVVGAHPFECQCHLLPMPTERHPEYNPDGVIALKQKVVQMYVDLGDLWDWIDQMYWIPRPNLRVVEPDPPGGDPTIERERDE